jgi:hypothetical protein
LTANREARLLVSGHGGRILLPRDTKQHIGEDLPEGLKLKDRSDRTSAPSASPAGVIPKYRGLGPVCPNLKLSTDWDDTQGARR